MKTLIVPIDFSGQSYPALNWAVVLAEHLVAKIELVHVLEITDNDYAGKEQVKTSFTENKLNRLTDKYSSQNPDLVFSYIVKEGEIEKEIVSQAESYSDAIIVASTESDFNWPDKVFGSRISRMIELSVCPIFIVSNNQAPRIIRKIVLPIENTPETREKVPYATYLAKLFDAEIDVVAVQTSNFEDIKLKLTEYAYMVNRHLTLHNINNRYTELNGNNFAELVLDYTNLVQADLICAMTEHQKTFTNLFKGSYTQQLLEKTTVPIMFIPTKQIGIVNESFKTAGISY